MHIFSFGSSSINHFPIRFRVIIFQISQFSNKLVFIIFKLFFYFRFIFFTSIFTFFICLGVTNPHVMILRSEKYFTFCFTFPVEPRALFVLSLVSKISLTIFILRKQTICLCTTLQNISNIMHNIINVTM